MFSLEPRGADMFLHFVTFALSRENKPRLGPIYSGAIQNAVQYVHVYRAIIHCAE